MKFKTGYAMESWSSTRSNAVTSWLKATFGPPSTKDDDSDGEWHIYQDYDLVDLLLSDKARALAILKFPFLT